MEPSLRSSSHRVVECKLRRTDSALHETTKRFVESLHNDVRISQYADMKYAAGKMENGKWYWLDPSEFQSGYLIFIPEQPVLWIDEQFKMSFRIPMRVSAQIYEKKSIMIASLNKAEGILRLEDAWMIAGKSYFDDPFSKRWEALGTFYRSSYKVDSFLQRGLTIQPASYEPLENAAGWTHSPKMMLAQGESFPRRLRVQLQLAGAAGSTPAQSVKTPPAQSVKTSTQKPVARVQQVQKPKSNDVIAVPHEEHPDAYNIWIGGVKKGYAAIQDLALSQQLRAASSKGELRVKVEWNPEFSMYEIVSLM